MNVKRVSGHFFVHFSIKVSSGECMAQTGLVDRYTSPLWNPSGLALLPLWLMPYLPSPWVLVDGSCLASLLRWLNFCLVYNTFVLFSHLNALHVVIMKPHWMAQVSQVLIKLNKDTKQRPVSWITKHFKIKDMTKTSQHRTLTKILNCDCQSVDTRSQDLIISLCNTNLM